ncbi:MAG: Crp/Fnr family transcriptional regulator [Bacteroidetes bacterium]|nr:MAG: Crp/Fnr family transcriptional regulator [Bacteroidota bacterium]
MRLDGVHVGCEQCKVRMQSVFNALNTEELQELTQHKSCAQYKKGQVIFNEQGLPLGLFCVNSGKIKLSKTGFDGKEQILRLSKAGDVLGYRALLANERYHCSAVAVEDSMICVIDKGYFLDSTKQNNKLLFEMVRKMSSDLKTAEDHIVSLSQKNVRERMAEALLFIKATYGFAEDGQTLNVVLSREEIADFVGTSTETAIRLLSEFNHDKIIELVGKKIKLVNLDKLIKTANLND